MIIKWKIHLYPSVDFFFSCTLGDQIKIVGSQAGTTCYLSQRNSVDGQIAEIEFLVNAGGLFTRDIVSGNTYRLLCDQKVMLAQVITLTHWQPLHNNNYAHLGTGPLFKFNGILC